MTTAPRIPTGPVQKQVVKLLRENHNQVYSPQRIANTLNLKPGSVRKALQRLTDRDPPAIIRVDRGLYRAWRDPGNIEAIENPKPELHGIQLTSKLSRNRGWGPPGGAPESFGSIRETSPWSVDETNGQRFASVAWRGRRVKVAVSPSTGAVQVNVRAGDEPLDPDEFSQLLTWLGGWFEGQRLAWDADRARVSSVELNRDYQRLAIDGIEKVRLGAWVNGWVKFYEREDGTFRSEVRYQEYEDGRLTAGELGALAESMARMADGGDAPRPRPRPEEFEGARPESREDHEPGPEVA